VRAAFRWGLVLTPLLVLRHRLELIARAEHELRGPVTVLALACEQLARHEAAAHQGRLLEVQLDRLRAGLRDLEAARRGRRSAIYPSMVELRSFAGAAIAPWRHVLSREGRGASLTWEGGGAPLRIDPGRLSQALGNLLANAVEHGAGDIELRGRRTSGGIRLEVRNRHRKGIPPPRRGRGLAIAGKAARELGGRVRVDSLGDSVVAALELPDEPATAEAEHAEVPSDAPIRDARAA
jgi:signal transduction histidine kinase